MFCPHCGKQVQAGDAFCPSCGKPLPNRQYSAKADDSYSSSQRAAANEASPSTDFSSDHAHGFKTGGHKAPLVVICVVGVIVLVVCVGLLGNRHPSSSSDDEGSSPQELAAEDGTNASDEVVTGNTPSKNVKVSNLKLKKDDRYCRSNDLTSLDTYVITGTLTNGMDLPCDATITTVTCDYTDNSSGLEESGSSEIGGTVLGKFFDGYCAVDLRPGESRDFTIIHPKLSKAPCLMEHNSSGEKPPISNLKAAIEVEPSGESTSRVGIPDRDGLIKASMSDSDDTVTIKNTSKNTYSRVVVDYTRQDTIDGIKYPLETDSITFSQVGPGETASEQLFGGHYGGTIKDFNIKLTNIWLVPDASAQDSGVSSE